MLLRKNQKNKTCVKHKILKSIVNGNMCKIKSFVFQNVFICFEKSGNFAHIKCRHYKLCNRKIKIYVTYIS